MPRGENEASDERAYHQCRRHPITVVSSLSCSICEFENVLAKATMGRTKGRNIVPLGFPISDLAIDASTRIYFEEICMAFLSVRDSERQG